MTRSLTQPAAAHPGGVPLLEFQSEASPRLTDETEAQGSEEMLRAGGERPEASCPGACGVVEQEVTQRIRSLLSGGPTSSDELPENRGLV